MATDPVQHALEAYLRLVREFHYPHGDALMAALTTNRFVSRTDLTRAIEAHNLSKKV